MPGTIDHLVLIPAFIFEFKPRNLELVGKIESRIPLLSDISLVHLSITADMATQRFIFHHLKVLYHS